jgi:hypothetical protein
MSKREWLGIGSSTQLPCLCDAHVVPPDGDLDEVAVDHDLALECAVAGAHDETGAARARGDDGAVGAVVPVHGAIALRADVVPVRRRSPSAVRTLLSHMGHTQPPADVVCSVERRDHVHGAAVAVGQQPEEDVAEEGFRDTGAGQRQRCVRKRGVVRVELWRHALDGLGIVCVRRRRDGAPPLVGDRPRGEDDEVAPGPIIVDLHWQCLLVLR